MKIKNLITTFIALTIVLCSIQSCALIISGSNQKVTFTSDTEGATVTSNLDSIGITNQEIKIPRTSLGNLYTISKEGCIDTSIVLETRYNWLTAIDAPLVLPYLYDVIFDVHVKTDKVIEVNLTCPEK